MAKIRDYKSCPSWKAHDDHVWQWHRALYRCEGITEDNPVDLVDAVKASISLVDTLLNEELKTLDKVEKLVEKRIRNGRSVQHFTTVAG